MKASILAYGNREEIEPIVAFALGLIREGNEVLFVSNHAHRDWVTAYGLRFGQGDPIDPVTVCEAGGSFISAGDSKGWLWFKISEFHKAFSHVDQATLGCVKRATDVLLCNAPAVPIGMAVARRLKLPLVGIFPTPETMTKDFPYPPLGLGKGFMGLTNTWSYTQAQRMVWGMIGKTITNWHKCRVGVPVISDANLNLSFVSQQDVTILTGVGTNVMPRPSDWGRWVHMTGVWALDPPASWTPHPEMKSFMERGVEPVYIGFGSLSSHDLETYAAIGMEALELANMRGILHSDWKGFQAPPFRRPRSARKKRICNMGGGPGDTIDARDIPVDILADSDMPQRWVFPRCSVIVHAGSYASTASAMLSGVPSVVCPFVGEQRFWAQHLLDMGLASAIIPVEKLSASSLAAAIRETAANPKLRERAEKVRDQLLQLDGVGAAIDVLNRFMKRPWDRSAMQVLPRRMGDLEMQEGLFRSWGKYNFVLKDHAVEFHNYLPTGLVDPEVAGNVYLAGGRMETLPPAPESRFPFKVLLADGTTKIFSAASERLRQGWMNSFQEVCDSWEQANSGGGGWSQGVASKFRDGLVDGDNVLSTAHPSVEGDLVTPHLAPTAVRALPTYSISDASIPEGPVVPKTSKDLNPAPKVMTEIRRVSTEPEETSTPPAPAADPVLMTSLQPKTDTKTKIPPPSFAVAPVAESSGKLASISRTLTEAGYDEDEDDDDAKEAVATRPEEPVDLPAVEEKDAGPVNAEAVHITPEIPSALIPETQPPQSQIEPPAPEKIDDELVTETQDEPSHVLDDSDISAVPPAHEDDGESHHVEPESEFIASPDPPTNHTLDENPAEMLTDDPTEAVNTTNDDDFPAAAVAPVALASSAAAKKKKKKGGR